MHPAAIDPDELLRQCDTTRTRRSGPGGQNRNKVETAVILTHRPTGLSAEGSERRSQEQNRAMALFRLRLKLAVEVRGSTERGTPPSERWASRRRGTQIKVNDEHADFPAMIAEALDHLWLRDMDVPAAAKHLGVTATQLVNLLRQHRPALDALNAERAKRHQPPLR